MKICVLDLEFNQPSKTIIEIGACCLDVKTGKITSTFRTYVDPKENIDPFITELTGITQLDVDGEPSITQATESFWKWMKDAGCNKTLSSWGKDYFLIIKTSQDLNIPFERPNTLDIKVMGSIFRCIFPNVKNKGGLLNTMTLFNLSFVGKQHRALDDATNTANLLYKFKKMAEVYNQINTLLDQ